jgi:signal transduction histidine kinase/ActR/RegA family two-component response regulator/HAMP domain-containing protein
LLVAACTIPAFALLLYDAWRASEQQMEDARQALHARAKGAAGDIERDLASARQLLRAMAGIPEIAGLRRDECAKQLPLLAGSFAPVGNAAGIAADGTPVCNAARRAAPGTALNVSDRDYFQKALASRDVVLGDPLAARGAAGIYVLPVALAVRDADGRATGVMVASINLSHFAEEDAASWADPDTTVTLWDRTVRVAFRWPDPRPWVGKSYAATPLGRDLLARSEGAFDAEGVDGLRRLHGFVSVAGTDLKIDFSVPREAVVAPIRAMAERNAVLLAAIVMAGMALAWLLSEALIRRPLSRLAGTATRMGEGDLEARCGAPYTADEVGSVSRAFDHMAGALAERIEALRLSEARLRDNLEHVERAERRVRQQLQHMNLLDQITRSIGDRLDLQSIFQVVVRVLQDSLPVDFSCIALHEEPANALRVARMGAASDALADKLALGEQEVFGVDNNGLSRCMHGELVYEPDTAQLPFPFPERLARAGLSSLVLAPLRSESRVFGVLGVARAKGGGFSSIECEFLRQLAEHVALAAGQARLHSALREAYDELRRTQQAAMQEERLRALGQMASGVAHDINNALSPVALYAESLLENEPGLSERARGYLKTMARAVEDVAHTVARLREFYRQREEQVALAPVDLNALVGQVLDLTRARWSDMPLRRGVVVRARADLAAGLPAIMGVEAELRDALTNLVFNAVDAMPEGGALVLRTQRLPASGEQGPRVAVDVVDQGVGMDEATRARCLEPFFTTKGERGTGLGLAMVFGAARRHSAELEIDSTPGAGTSVRMLFPVPEAVAAEPVPADAPEVPRGLSLLLVDDDPVLLKSLSDILGADGHRVKTASNGREAIALFRASNGEGAGAGYDGSGFDAVFTDLGMPYMDGRKVAENIKSISPSTPVILLTGWGRRLVAEGDIPPHVDSVLAKPPRLRELRAALARLCAARV